MLRVVVILGVPLAAVVGMLLGVYVVAERWLSSSSGCVACGRTWHRTNDTGLDRSPNVRVIARADIATLEEGEHHEQ
jgi:hypothetical protein